ncbi:MerR family transcriptional regulator [Arthrobacter sp.]|uniref:MerR family transcriptional regulator n=1 Tax=Arthrobacter sp. TaxID=1667 RepID=UPI0035C76E08
MSKASLGGRKLLRVGEVASLTGVSPRLIRYYENQGLISAERSSTGQRHFEITAVEQIRHIRLLLDAGLPTRIISELLDCIHDPGRLELCAVPTLVEHLRARDERIAELVSTRQALQGLIDSSNLGPDRRLAGS